jgi:4-hydroxy-3-methylbut-2-enyl diphosphate reductase
LAALADVILVVGSENSSNSNRLRELAEHCGVEAYLLDSPDLLQRKWLADKEMIGITAGASAPEELVQAIISRLKDWGADVEVIPMSGVVENMVFALPRELRVSTSIDA